MTPQKSADQTNAPFTKKVYHVKIILSIYRNGILSYKNELIVPSAYQRRSEARGHIQKEIRTKLDTSNFFRSSRPDYDLVRYTEEASCNTFLRYGILETEIELT